MSTDAPLGTVDAVSVGKPRSGEYKGRRVSSGIVKSPVCGPVYVSYRNLDGDGQADPRFHGGVDKAVYAYPRKHYAHWQRELGRKSLPLGQFGENLTLSGIDETNIRIGDVLRIGTTVLQVSEPRVPCFKLTMHMRAGDDFSQRFLASRRVGFYLRVVQPGYLQRGDRVEIVASTPSATTVDEFVRIALTPERTLDELRSLTGFGALSDAWHVSIRNQISTLLRSSQPTWSGFRPFRIHDIARETATVSTFRLEPASGERSLPTWLPGQHIVVARSADGPRRCYSLSSLETRFELFTITVKRETAPDGQRGRLSNWLHDSVAGTQVLVGAPRGSFHIDPGTSRPLVLIAAGVGITPLMPMAEHVAPRGTPVTLLHAVRDADNRIRAGLLRRLAARNPAVAVHFIHSNVRRLGRDHLERLIRPEALEHGDFFICGPDRFMADVRSYLHEFGVPGYAVHSESFSGNELGRQPQTLACDDPASIVFARSGLEATWTGAHYSLLDFAESVGVPVSFGCRAGSCRQCAVRLLSGTTEYLEWVDEPDAGQVLLCCTVPQGDIVLDL